jgi:hypothetical protein
MTVASSAAQAATRKKPYGIDKIWLAPKGPCFRLLFCTSSSLYRACVKNLELGMPKMQRPNWAPMAVRW